MGVFSFIILIVALVTFGEVCSKWLESARAREPIAPPDDGEMAQLREQVELLADRVDRLNEEQRFITRLLEESPRVSALPRGAPRSSEDDSASPGRGPDR